MIYCDLFLQSSDISADSQKENHKRLGILSDVLKVMTSQKAVRKMWLLAWVKWGH